MRTTVFGIVLLSTVSLSAWADTEKPSTVNGVSAEAISDTSVRVTWNKPFDNVGVVGYNIYKNGAYFTTVFDTNHVDNEVSSDNDYEYRIVAFDKARNFTSLSSAANVSTGGSNNNDSGASVAPPPPAPAPSDGGVNAPDGLYSEIQDSNNATIKWRAPSGSIRGYNVYKDGSYIKTVHTPEYKASGLNWGQDHTFIITAFSTSGRFSGKSSPLTVNTANGSSSQSAPVANYDQPQNDGGTPKSSDNGSVPDGYRMVFSDEFNQNSLDSSKWNSKYRWGPGWVINGEKQYYVDRINNPDFGHSPFEFDGNHMTITAIKTPEHLRASANWQPYLSGALTTYNKFQMKYGYVEMRAQLPKGKGLWSAFWLLHQTDNNNRPEIDVVEYIGNQPDRVYHTYHHYENWNLRSTPSYKTTGTDYSQDMHTYGVKWEPGKITWYVDGVASKTYENGNVAQEDMYLLVNLALGGWWPGDPDDSTEFPARFKIDYIRAYQK